jgi:hypothetical protein
MKIQKQTAGTLPLAPPLFSSAGAKHQRSFDGLVLSESASASVCTARLQHRPSSWQRCLCMQLQGVGVEREQIECSKSPFFWHIIVDEFEATA